MANAIFAALNELNRPFGLFCEKHKHDLAETVADL